ncbi:DUF5320 family protein [uncultured Thiodictyon sp.]|uniref:DUF5320 family protein n=1 Tax=uncultured Thiodictyon sp. TaxID=1846217 RepID=UPI00343C80CC
MPYRDGTGPAIQRTNAERSVGRCAGRGSAGRPGGRGFGGRGRGRGATGPDPGLDAGQDRSWISNQIKGLQAAIQGLTARLNALNKE